MKRSAACLDTSGPASTKLSRSAVPVGNNASNYGLLLPSKNQNGFVHVDTPRPKLVRANSNGQNGSNKPAVSTCTEEMCDESRSPEFFLKLSALNRTFARWIENYMAKGVHYDFTPVCNDYIRFINNLRQKYPELETDDIESSMNTSSIATTNNNNNNTINNSSNLITETSIKNNDLSSQANTNSSIQPKNNLGSPGKTPMPKASASTNVSIASPLESSGQNSMPSVTISKPGEHTSTPFPKFEFGKISSSSTDLNNTSEVNNSQDNKATASSTNIVKSLFTFDKPNDSGSKPATLGSLGQTPFTFNTSIFNTPASNTPAANTDADKKPTEGGEEEEYEPPKPETVNFEEDALYSVKCKLFYKNENKFLERGKGMLYLKKMDGEDSNKHQLLIRADNANGTVLLNIFLSKSLPTSQSKSGILLTCIPNPPLESNEDQPETDNNKAVTFFVKVKNNDTAKETIEKLKELQATN